MNYNFQTENNRRKTTEQERINAFLKKRNGFSNKEIQKTTFEQPVSLSTVGNAIREGKESYQKHENLKQVCISYLDDFISNDGYIMIPSFSPSQNVDCPISKSEFNDKLLEHIISENSHSTIVFKEEHLDSNNRLDKQSLLPLVEIIIQEILSNKSIN